MQKVFDWYRFTGKLFTQKRKNLGKQMQLSSFFQHVIDLLVLVDKGGQSHSTPTPGALECLGLQVHLQIPRGRDVLTLALKGMVDSVHGPLREHALRYSSDFQNLNVVMPRVATNAFEG